MFGIKRAKREPVSPIRRLVQGCRGQSTVELAVCLPVLLGMILLTYHFTMYLSACARFDPLAAEAVRSQATSPGAGQYAQAARAGLVQDCLSQGFGDNYDVTISVTIQSVSFIGSVDMAGGVLMSMLPQHERVVCTMEYRPRGIPSSVFGLALPTLTHSREFVIDPYRPGGLF